jgi:quinol monooxygenase YgiN
MHPLTPDLAGLSLEELTNKHSELLKKMTMAYRWGNPDMVQQLQMLLEDYQNELNLRNQKQLEEMQKASKQFKNIIDIQ